MDAPHRRSYSMEPLEGADTANDLDNPDLP